MNQLETERRTKILQYCTKPRTMSAIAVALGYSGSNAGVRGLVSKMEQEGLLATTKVATGLNPNPIHTAYLVNN